jgi:hypothetical protein
MPLPWLPSSLLASEQAYSQTLAGSSRAVDILHSEAHATWRRYLLLADEGPHTRRARATFFNHLLDTVGKGLSWLGSYAPAL